MGIGSLNESPLHLALKDLYSVAHSTQEVPIGAFVADVLHPERLIIEIQTSGFARLRRKLAVLLETYRVVLVYPVAQVRHIIRLTDELDEAPATRRSPKRGRVADVLAELVSIPQLLNHPNFELEVLLIELDEFRRQVPGRARRRNGWVVVQRRLRAVVDRQRFRSSTDLYALLGAPLAASFSTADLAAAMAAPRHLAQKLAFCLRACGEIEACGKNGNAILYRRVSRP
jgi:hypothetical protein